MTTTQAHCECGSTSVERGGRTRPACVPQVKAKQLMSPAISRVTSLGTLTIASALFLSACSNPLEGAIEDAVGNAVEGGVEQAIENESGGDVDINIGGDVDLPADFPSDIPVLDSGEMISSLKVDTGWIVNWINVDAGAIETFIGEFGGGGWSEISASDMGDFKAYAYENDTYQASVGVVTDGETLSVTYTVSTKATS